MLAYSTRDTRVAKAGAAGVWAVLLVGIALATLAGGCRATSPRAATQPAVPTHTNAELVEYISDMPFVTAEAAYRAVYILANGEIFQGDYDALTEQMKAAGLVRSNWTYRADEFVDRAAVGYLVARACDIRTGLNWRLTGLGRYAHRELVYRRIAHPSGELGLISGGEFLGVLARAEEHLHKIGRGPGEKAELGAAPSP